jgi:hypothetical protein
MKEQQKAGNDDSTPTPTPTPQNQPPPGEWAAIRAELAAIHTQLKILAASVQALATQQVQGQGKAEQPQMARGENDDQNDGNDAAPWQPRTVTASRRVLFSLSFTGREPMPLILEKHPRRSPKPQQEGGGPQS